MRTLFRKYYPCHKQSLTFSYQLNNLLRYEEAIPVSIPFTVFSLLFLLTPHVEGQHQILWQSVSQSGNAVPPGLYFYRITVQNEKGTVTKSGKIMKVR